jgi:glycosyltransferase involved in cell wall biosynthesis
MRVAFVDQSGDSMGGAQRSLAILLRALPRDISPHAVLFCDGAYAASLRSWAIPVTIVPMPNALMSTTRENPFRGLAAVPFAISAVARTLREVGADIIYTNTVKAHTIALPAARLIGTRAIVHLRDILHGTGRAVVRSLIAAGSGERIAISGAVRDAFALPGTHVIPNPLDLETYTGLPDRGAARAQIGIPPDVHLVSLIGRINRWKGHDRFLQIAKMLDRTDTHYAIVGAPMFRDADFVDELHGFVQREGLSGRVHFVPWLEDVRVAYAATDINVNCSEDEPFGRTLIEAAACGVPSIAFASGGTSEALIDGEAGTLVPAGDNAAFAAALTAYLDAPGRLARAGEAARVFSRTFDAPTHAARVAEVLYRANSR